MLSDYDPNYIRVGKFGEIRLVHVDSDYLYGVYRYIKRPPVCTTLVLI